MDSPTASEVAIRLEECQKRSHDHHQQLVAALAKLGEESKEMSRRIRALEEQQIRQEVRLTAGSKTFIVLMTTVVGPLVLVLVQFILERIQKGG